MRRPRLHPCRTCGDAETASPNSQASLAFPMSTNAHLHSTLFMHTRRAHQTCPYSLLPDELLRKIDSLVGPRRRSSLLSRGRSNRGTASKAAAVSRRQGAGRERTGLARQRHPELAAGIWVRKLRLRMDARPESRRAGENTHAIADGKTVPRRTKDFPMPEREQYPLGEN